MKSFVKAATQILSQTLIVSFSLLALSACNTFQEAQDSETFIFLQPEETLYVKFLISPDLLMEQQYPSVVEETVRRRYEQYFTSMRSLLQVYRFPMDVVLLEEHDSAGDGPLLDLFATRWELDRFGEINVVLRAKLERYGDLNTLGVFSKREIPSALSSFERTEQAFARTMEAALSEMFAELNNHFETAEEEAFVEGETL